MCPGNFHTSPYKLTLRTEVCAALTNDHSLNRRAADGAGLALTVVHPKIILILTAAIDPINGCAVAADAFLQDLADRFVQRLSLSRRHRIGRGDRMQFR